MLMTQKFRQKLVRLQNALLYARLSQTDPHRKGIDEQAKDPV
jgi:hypothetical protein